MFKFFNTSYAILKSMKRGNIPFGFTIIETMIFLAVSGALLASSLLLVSGSQNKSQFNNAVRDLNRKLLK